MNHFESELAALRSDFAKQWELVSLQLKNSMHVLSSMDKEKAKEIMALENKVNELDLKIEKNCENIIALYNPVAIDLRFILALIKMNTHLEKAGDIASRVAKFVIKSEDNFYTDLITKTNTLVMFEEACELLEDTFNAYKTNDAQKAREIFKRDEHINEINKSALLSLIESIKENPEQIEKYLKMQALIRRVEKAGDLSKNLAEEIIFYLEAKVLRHREK